MYEILGYEGQSVVFRGTVEAPQISNTESHTKFQRHIKASQIVRSFSLKSGKIVNRVLRSGDSLSDPYDSRFGLSFRLPRATW